MAFIQYFSQIMFAVMMVSMMSFMLPRAQASAIRIAEVLDVEGQIQDADDADLLTVRPTSLTFDHVTFFYPGAEEPALSDINFEAHSGETVAIIGGTGAGKSTLMNLIPRFYDVQQGSIRLDGVDIRNFTVASLREHLGVVSQRPALFSGTVLDNVRYGKWEATPDEARQALITAQAWEFVEEMPEQLDTYIDQGGVNLSGGQKQRLSLARAFVRGPALYLFDDTFSALDYKTESLLRQSLRDTTQNCIVLIVAQRVATIMDADQILVLDDGRIVGRGTHSQLMKTSDVYREIVASQLSPEEIA